MNAKEKRVLKAALRLFNSGAAYYGPYAGSAEFHSSPAALKEWERACKAFNAKRSPTTREQP